MHIWRYFYQTFAERTATSAQLNGTIWRVLKRARLYGQRHREFIDTPLTYKLAMYRDA